MPMLPIIREPATVEQVRQMGEAFGGALIKLAVDVARGILAGGGELHADCERALLEDGGRQEDIWGADWYSSTREVGFESLINIRPRQQNFTLELQNPSLRDQVEAIVRHLLDVPFTGVAKSVRDVRERYQALDWPQQLGNLASTLARISTRASSPQYDALVTDLLREAALLVEWSAPTSPASFWLELAAMQREALAWRHLWPLDQARSLLALQTRNQSDRLLQMAGLLEGAK
jgi:hypothetical protein